jgi:uncharacterized protein
VTSLRPLRGHPFMVMKLLDFLHLASHAELKQVFANNKSMIRATVRALSLILLLLTETVVHACRLCFPLRVLPMPVSRPTTYEPIEFLGFDLNSIRQQRPHQLPRRDLAFVDRFGFHPPRVLSNEILWSSSPQNDSSSPAVNTNTAFDEDDVMAQQQPQDEESPVPAIMSSSMIGAIGFYKFWISPLLPPACRFVPTCSIYGIEAIKEFGPYKGAILTAWRILRCSPFGGKGYDPPKWPPVFYTYSSY